jgi:isopenicillin N synthase-like dioxygenase
LTDAPGIAVIDIAPLGGGGAARAATVEAIGVSCREIGFLCVTGTGVDPALVAAMRRVSEAVFAVPEAEKHAQAITRANYRGYIPLGFFSPNDGSGAADRYEGYKLHRETAPDDPIREACSLYGPNLWPRGVPGMRETVLAYWAEMDRVAALLLGALAEGLGLDSEVLIEPFDAPLTNMTLLHYPAGRPDAPGYGIHPHKDTDALTIIAPDPVGGLEVRAPGGGWLEPDCPPGGFVVNIGDMLELWSGGRLVSTPHRVLNRSGRARHSFPYFAVPRHDVTVRPLLPPVPGFDRPAVNCGHWSAEIWRTNWPDEIAGADGPELGTLVD